MKKLFVIPLLMVSFSLHAQDFAYKQLLLDGMLTSLSKAQIEKVYGKGKVNFTEYECGFYANEQNSAPYYQLIFKDHIFIGNDTEGFTLESFNFSATTTPTLTYKGKALSHKTTKQDFAEIFGANSKTYFKESPESDQIHLSIPEADDGIRFHFKSNKLVQYTYWSPC